MTDTSLPAPAWSEPVRPRGVRRVLLDSGYALSAFFLALPAFVLVVVNLALGIGLIVLVGGLLLLWVAVMVARGFARLERIRLRGMLGKQARDAGLPLPPARGRLLAQGAAARCATRSPGWTSCGAWSGWSPAPWRSRSRWPGGRRRPAA